MRLGVLDIGSNTVHLLVVDARRGAAPAPAYAHKAELRLAEHLDGKGRIDPEGVEALTDALADAVEVAEDKGCASVLAFATSALRDARNGEKVLAALTQRFGIAIDVLDGAEEARLTYLAARRWFGWSSGRMVLFDIGGGSLEIAAGSDGEPAVTFSVPLGAGRLTREALRSDPPDPDEVTALRSRIRRELADVAGDVLRAGPFQRAVATSKTFRSLARICGAAPAEDGIYVPRTLTHADLSGWMPKLSAMTTSERGELPGVSEGRAAQLLAGALVADAVFDLFEAEEMDLCPWALREGVILARFDQL